MIVEYVRSNIRRAGPASRSCRRPHQPAANGRANTELIRKHYIADENGNGGAHLHWPSKEAAQRGHNAEWLANIKERTGSTPTIRYFDLTMIVDNEAGTVTEYPANMPAQAAE